MSKSPSKDVAENVNLSSALGAAGQTNLTTLQEHPKDRKKKSVKKSYTPLAHAQDLARAKNVAEDCLLVKSWTEGDAQTPSLEQDRLNKNMHLAVFSDDYSVEQYLEAEGERAENLVM